MSPDRWAAVVVSGILTVGLTGGPAHGETPTTSAPEAAAITRGVHTPSGAAIGVADARIARHGRQIRARVTWNPLHKRGGTDRFHVRVLVRTSTGTRTVADRTRSTLRRKDRHLALRLSAGKAQRVRSAADVVLSVSQQFDRARRAGRHYRLTYVSTLFLRRALPIGAGIRDCSALPIVDGADLHDCDFHGANLSQAEFIRANLAGADFTGADLTSADLVSTDLTGAVFRNADMTMAGPAFANLRNADLTHANLTQASLERSDLTGATFSEAVLHATDLTKVNMSGVNLSGLDLRESHLVGALGIATDLTGAQLSDADLTGAYLTRAQLVGADLSRAIMNRTGLRGVNLRGAILRGADLTGATLPGPTLYPEADFSGATWPTGRVCGPASIGQCV